MNKFSYKNLIVWQKSIQLVKLIYNLTEKFPDSEKFGLVSQIRRCSVSIPSNIAEGRMRRTEKEFRQFLFIAYGSGAELETLIEISKQLNLISDSTEIETLLLEVMKMLNTLLFKY